MKLKKALKSVILISLILALAGLTGYAEDNPCDEEINNPPTVLIEIIPVE